MSSGARLDPRVFEYLRNSGSSDNPLKVLMAFRDRLGTLTEDDLRSISTQTRIPLSQLFGVATFYKVIGSTEAVASIRVCDGVACRLAGSDKILDKIQSIASEIGAPDPEKWICLGCCPVAPAAEILLPSESGSRRNTIVIGSLDSENVKHRLAAALGGRVREMYRADGCLFGAFVDAPEPFQEEVGHIGSIVDHRAILANEPQKPRLLVCTGASCLSRGSRVALNHARENQVESVPGDWEVRPTGCFGMCGFMGLYSEDGEVHWWDTPDDPVAHSIMRSASKDHWPGFVLEPPHGIHIAKEAPEVIRTVTEYLRTPPSERGPRPPPAPRFRELDFDRLQTHLITRNSGSIDPDSLNEYIGAGGYTGLDRALTLTVQQVIDEMRKSNLRGRGGAGFPTGLKWQFCANEKRMPKYVICNANEGDPGSYMDRYLMESDPHQVIEGLMISAYAVGAEKGFIYLREDFRVARARLERAITQLKQAGLLGKGILGSSFNFDVEVFVAPHAYVCGEEYALMASIEGKRGEPRPRPPYPAQSGLWGQPTNVNNVKTLCYATIILEKGGDWFAQTGTGARGGKSTGTFLIGLSGDVKRGGLVEVPMGTPIRDVVYRIGGGTKSGLKVKGVHLDGPSGGTIPESMFDLTLDYESFQKVGWALGAGAMSVVNEKHCIVRLLHYLMGFMHEESCGRCFPCREGTKHMERALERMMKFEATEEDVKMLDLLSSVIQDTSICGLGVTAPVPLLTAKKYFPEELAAHLRGECPAGQCKKS
jgi:NADH-quinone oxidoreductase subunit F